VLSIIQEETPVFDAQFSRCRGLLYFIACRVLDDYEGAGEAVQNCLLTDTRNTPKFESVGALRSWLLRILIDEALQILRFSGRKRTSTTT
jgi:DNA-directed RNA polymerase specialized sigma24 family protein